MKPRKHEGGMGSQDARIAVLETTISHIHEALERIDKRFDNIDKRFDVVDRKFELLENKFDTKIETLEHKFDNKYERLWEEMTKFRQEMRTDFKTLDNRLWYGFFWIVASFAGVLALIAKSFHWF